MNGVLNIYKERGITSFGVVAHIRRITGEKKAGHAGTLDPDAAGVLPVCLGKATKLVGQLEDTDKEYRARLLFSKSTDTLDAAGRVLEEMPPEKAAAVLESSERIRNAILSFKGELKQLPPMYSALKVGGVKLVDAARRGMEIERTPRQVTVYDIFDIEISPDLLSAAFTVSCSKGTYIRTLCDDIGKLLGVPSCMGSLVRTRACGFCVHQSRTLSQVEAFMNEGRLDEILIPPDKMLENHALLVVKDDALKRLVSGNFMYPEDFEPGQHLNIPGIYRIYDNKGLFYGLYRYNEGERFYRCEKMFVEQKPLQR